MHFGIIPILGLAVPAANAWGDVGNRTIGYLAEKHLSSKAAALCDDLLANDRGFDISDAACWADTQKRSMPWSRGFHFISKHAHVGCYHVIMSNQKSDPKGDDPPANCTVEWPDDCASKEGCVVSAIVNYVGARNGGLLSEVRLLACQFESSPFLAPT